MRAYTPVHSERIVVRAGTVGFLSVHFNAILTQRLGLCPRGDRLLVEYGRGPEEWGCLRLVRAFARETAVIPIFPRMGGSCGFNLSVAFLPEALAPDEDIVLPHRWRSRYLLLDYRPLQKISAQLPLPFRRSVLI